MRGILNTGRLVAHSQLFIIHAPPGAKLAQKGPQPLNWTKNISPFWASGAFDRGVPHLSALALLALTLLGGERQTWVPWSAFRGRPPLEPGVGPATP